MEVGQMKMDRKINETTINERCDKVEKINSAPLDALIQEAT